MIFTKTWWRAALIRAAKTVAQVMLSMIAAAALLSEVQWFSVLGAALLAGAGSILMSLAGLPEVAGDTMPWWKAALYRALKTGAQAAAGLLATAVTIWEVNWIVILSTVALAVLSSILTSLVGLPEAQTTKEE